MRLIDADALIADLDKGLWGKDYDKVLAEAIIKDAPSTDIVRCFECKYWVSDGGALRLCDIHKDPTVPEHFCSYGESDSEKPNKSEIPTGSERVGKYPYNCNWDE